MSKTIWYISKYMTPPYAARVGARGFMILREMARLGQRAVLVTSDSNHLADVPKIDGREFVEVVDGVDVLWLKTRKYDSARSLGRILSWFDFEWQLWRHPKGALPRPDVVIVSSPSPLAIFNGLWLRRKHRCKLVFEVRDIWPLTLVAAGGYSSSDLPVLFMGIVERLSYRQADLIVGTMPNLGEHVEKVLGEKKIVACIPQGLDEQLLADQEPLPEGYVELYIPSDRFVVCHAGTIGADNALETLMACAGRMVTTHPRIHFLVVGDGYLKADFERRYANLANVTFAPGVPKKAVQSVLARCNLLYFAAHRSPLTQFGQSLNKIVDYMYAAKPIIGSYSGFPSMINEAGCGSFVPAEDADALRAEIERYFAMPDEERSRMGKRGRDWLLEHRRFATLASDYLRLL